MLLQDGLVVVTHALHVKGHWSRICSPKVLTPSPPTLTSRSFVLLHQSLIEGFSEHTITSSMSLQNFPCCGWHAKGEERQCRRKRIPEKEKVDGVWLCVWGGGGKGGGEEKKYTLVHSLVHSPET